jgi:hypothetical protein
MRLSFGVLLCGFGLLSLVACSGSENSLIGDPIRQSPEPPKSDTTNPPVDDPPAPACATDIAAPVQVATDATASDVHLTKRGVIYRVGPAVWQVGRDGKNRRPLYTSPNIVRSWFDDASIVLVEATEGTDNATLRVITIDNLTDPAQQDPKAGDLPGQAGVAAATNIAAAEIEIFASDLTGFYIQAGTGANEVLYRVEKANPGAMTTLVTAAAEITNPLLANGYVWYVMSGQRVYKVGAAQPVEIGDPNDNGETKIGPGAPPGAPQEVFGITYARPQLAIDAKNAFYTTGSALEKRDLTGANPATVLDTEKSKTKAGFGSPLAWKETVILPSATPDPQLKHVIRAVKVTEKGSEERLAACGRELPATGLVVDDTSIAWIEAGKGVFVAPR